MPRSGPRPHIRRYPDPVDHQLFTDCMRARAQAWYMGQEWTITEDEYIGLWRKNDLYKQKGRHSNEYCLTRVNYDKDWTIDNVQLITREEHYKYCNRHKIGKFATRKKQDEENTDV